MQIPQTGLSHEDVMAKLEENRGNDADWRHAKTWSLVYSAGEDIERVVKEAYLKYFSENALNPNAFPSLRQFEGDVISMAVTMLHGEEDSVGSMTTGGSESLLMAVKTAREWARENMPHVTEPEMLAPLSVHAAIEKASHYFGVKVVHIPLDAGFRADVAAARELVTPNTILIIGSAPAYPQGVMDPIEDLAALAQEKGILCHVDACLGGFLLPWVEKLGYPIRPFDFRVPGVTSISADIHKYGYAAKGASVILYRTRDLRRHQFFVYPDWPGGLYASPTMTGTRPGGAIAAAWAALNYIGEAGYMRLAKVVMDTTKSLQAGIRAIPELKILGEPDMSVTAFTSDDIDIYMLGDRMEERGWKLDRQQLPPCLHMMVTPPHAAIIEPFLSDLRECAASLQGTDATPEGAAAMYGMLNSLPDRDAVKDFLRDFMET
ncbi:MAG: aspartate aminotransferase family protein [Candidatus Sericytochromatia bacterium]|nr:aspartate aminotransferase family protein [Candidatus Sericytochromatia bacterium]